MPLSNTSIIGLTNRFRVTIDQHDLGSWAKAEGLDVSWDVCEYRAGDQGNMRWYFPGKTTYSKIKLTRAVNEGETKQVRTWLNWTSTQFEPQQTGKIVLLDSTGLKEIHDWELQSVMPAKWSISGFDSNGGAVATEVLELSHVGFLEDHTKA